MELKVEPVQPVVERALLHVNPFNGIESAFAACWYRFVSR